MKATVCATSPGAATGGVSSGRIHRQRRDIENEEIQMYLSKLKELVPFMPRNRRLSKLEVIQYVIDYICDLQYALETHPAVVTAVNGASPTVTTATAGARHSNAASNGATSPRQPLGVLAPNTIVIPSNPPTSTCATQEQTIITTPSHLEKVVPSDSRPVSC